MKHKTNLFATMGVCTAALFSAPPLEAREPIVRHDHPSGQNIYRVEIRDLRRLEVLEAGDSDGVGELDEVVIQLSAKSPGYETQYDGLKITGTELYSINHGGISAGRRNMPIREGQHVKAVRPGQSSSQTQMWVHVLSDPDNTDYYEPGRVSLEIRALELDCVGNRRCRRNSQGTVYISFKIPDFETQPPNTCGPSNTFRLEPLNGELQISGLSDTSVSSSTANHTRNDSWFLLTSHKKGGPRLQPFNADICIASTTRQPAIRQPTDAERNLARPRRRPR